MRDFLKHLESSSNTEPVEACKTPLLSTRGDPSNCPYTDSDRRECQQTRFHACSKCLDTEEFMRDILKRFESSSNTEPVEAFLRHKAIYKNVTLVSQPPPPPVPEIKDVAPMWQRSLPPVPEIMVPITADVHARRVIQRLAQWHDGKAFIEHLIALNHYTRNFAVTINKDPPLKTYEDIARAHRWNVHNYSISHPKFNARGRAQAKVQLIVDYTIEHLRHKEAVFEFLGQLFKFTNLELKRIRNEATPQYEENLRKLFHEAVTKATAEGMTKGAYNHQEMLLADPLYRSVCALGTWRNNNTAGRPPAPVPVRTSYLDELETYWAFFDPLGKTHALDFARAWSWMAGRKPELRYGEGEKKYDYPVHEIMQI